MKKFLAVTVAILMLMTVLTASATVVNPSVLPTTGVVFSDDFESYTAGAALPGAGNGWQYFSSGAISKIKGTNAVWLNESTSELYIGAKPAAFGGGNYNSGIIKYQFDVMVPSNLGTETHYWLSLWTPDWSKKVFPINVISGASSSTVCFGNSGHTGSRPNTTDSVYKTITNDEFHTITTILNFNEGTMKYMLDGKALTSAELGDKNYSIPNDGGYGYMQISDKGYYMYIDNFLIEILDKDPTVTEEGDADADSDADADADYGTFTAFNGNFSMTNTTDYINSGKFFIVEKGSGSETDNFVKRAATNAEISRTGDTVEGSSTNGIMYTHPSSKKYQALYMPLDNDYVISKGVVTIEGVIWANPVSTGGVSKHFNIGFGFHDTTRTAETYDWNTTWTDATLFGGLTPWSLGVSSLVMGNKGIGRAKIPGWYGESGDGMDSKWNDAYRESSAGDLVFGSTYRKFKFVTDLSTGVVKYYYMPTPSATGEWNFAGSSTIPSDYIKDAKYDAFVIATVDGNPDADNKIYLYNLKVTNEIYPDKMTNVKIINGSSELKADDFASISGSESFDVEFAAPSNVSNQKANIILAAYDGTVLKGIACKTSETVNAGNNKYTISINDKFAGADTIKAFVFTDFNDMYPLTDAAVYTNK